MAALPWLAINLGLIVTATGSIVHMSPFEWAIWTLVSTLGLWLGCAAVLVVTALIGGQHPRVSAALALIAFAGAGYAIEPNPSYLLAWFHDPLDPNFGPWLTATGILATMISAVPFLEVRPERFS